MSCSTLSSNDINHILKTVQSGKEYDVISSLQRIPSSCHWMEISYQHSGDTILHYSARIGLVNVVKYLLENYNPKSVDCKNKDDKTALHEASQFSQFRICEILLNNGASVNALKRGDWTPLMLACTKVNDRASFQTVEILLLHASIVNYKNKDGWTCLHLISRAGDENILKLLIEYGLNLTVKTTNGRSALHIAALHGNLRIIEVLLNLGLDVNEKDNCGNTPLCEAVLGKHLKVCQKLLEYKAETAVVNNCGYSLIHLAACEGHIDMLEFILKVLKFDINFVNKNNLTALHCAARKKQIETYKFLVMNGASESVCDNYSRTPLEYLQS